jgi:hypothetical protein
MSDPSIQDQIQQSVDSAVPPGPSQFNGGPIDPNAPPYAPPPNTPGVASSLPVPSSLQQEPDQRAFHAQVAQEEQQAAAADVAHHALFGKAIKSMVNSLNGTETRYQANPQTGEVEEVTVPNKPGQFFRNLLSGMLVGAAAGAGGETDKEGRPIPGSRTFTAGFGRGVNAIRQQQQFQDQQQYERAQNNLKSGMEREKLDDEEVWHSALTAHESVQTADLLHNMHAADEKTVENHNAASRAYQQSLIDAGAIPAQLNIGNKPVDTTDGNSFVAAYTKDPSIAHAAPGYQRHFISTTDLSELHYDGEHWVDDSGNPVNLGKHIEIRAYDLPTSTFKTPIQRSGKEINAARRQKVVDDDKTYSVSPEAMSGLYTLGSKEAAEDARTSNQRSLANQRDKQNKQIAEVTAKRNEAIAKANHNYYSTINANPANQENATKERDEALKAADESYQSELKALGIKPNAPAPKIFSPTKWKAAHPNEDVNAAINEAKQQGMTISN